MDLSNLISLLMRTQGYGDSGGTDDEYFQGQNRRLIQPELQGHNYNTTPGNPPVELQDGWMRSLIPYYTGEGMPGGQGNDDGRSHSLNDLMWQYHPNLMQAYQKAAKPDSLNNFNDYRDQQLLQEITRRTDQRKLKSNM